MGIFEMIQKKATGFGLAIILLGGLRMGPDFD
jgi:hypothetical protein